MSRKNLPGRDRQGMLEPTFLNENDNRLKAYTYPPGAGPLPSEDSDSFTHYWRVLSRRKGVLLLAALLGGSAAYLLTLPQAPVYRAQTALEVQNLNEDFLNMKNVSPMAPAPGFESPEYNIRTQTTLLQSRPVLERAVNKIGRAHV